MRNQKATLLLAIVFIMSTTIMSGCAPMPPSSDDVEVNELKYQRKSGPKMLLIGETVPDFSAIDLNGKSISLKEYRGKIVLLDFWATWCGPCVAEMPKVKKAYEKYRDYGFEIIGISLDYDESKLRAYVKDNDIGWRNVFAGQWSESPLSKKYQVKGIPAPWLIDRNGKLITTRARGGRLEPMVAKTLGKK